MCNSHQDIVLVMCVVHIFKCVVILKPKDDKIQIEVCFIFPINCFKIQVVETP